MTLPANVDTGLVAGRFLVGVIDGPDPDSEPDGLPAQGTITFTASVPYLPNPTANPAPVTILKAPIIGILDAEGYLCVRKPDGTAGARGVRLVATDDPDLSVQGWTWTVTYAFENVNGVTPRIASHSMALPSSATIDLTSVVKVPSSTGIGVEQAEALVAAAAQSAREAEAAAVAVADSPRATDEGVASLVTAGDLTTAALDRAYRSHVSVREHGAAGDGTTDDTVAVKAALLAGAGGNVYFPPGHYRLTANFDVPANTTISGAGSASTLLDWSTKPEFESIRQFLYWTPGTFTDQTLLAVAAVPRDVSVTVPAGHTFVAGDDVRIRADNLLWGEASPAEYQRILAVEGNVLHLSAPVFDTYALDQNATIEKAHLPSGGINSLSIKGKGINPAPSSYGDTAIRAGLVRDFIIRDVHFDDVENKCILLNSVLGASITDCHFRFDPSFTPLQYGVGVTGGCQMITMRSCSSWNDRHMFTTSTSAARTDEYRGVPRLMTITGCTAHGSWQAPIDTHRGGEYITITGNALTSESIGIKIRNAKALVSGNTVVGKKTSRGGAPRGIWVGLVAQDVRVTGNMVTGFADGIRVEMHGTEGANMRHVAITDNSVVDCDNGIRLGQTDSLHDVQISGNTITCPPAGYGVFLFAPASDIEINGNTIVGGHTGIYMSHPSNPLSGFMVHGNTMRGQSSYALLLRNLTNAWVMGNNSAGKELRFTDAAVNVTTVSNNAVVRDLTTGTTVIQK